MRLPDWLSASLAADAVGSAGVPDLCLRPMRPGERLAGAVTTVRVAEGDNLGLREARRRGPDPGEILLVHGSPTSRRAVTGEVVAAALQAAGFAGLITDGLIRDSNELAAMNFPVWARGTTPLGATRQGPFGLGEGLSFGGVAVGPGDFVIADDDGLVIWPQGDVAALLEKAEQRRQADAGRLERARAGQGLD